MFPDLLPSEFPYHPPWEDEPLGMRLAALDAPLPRIAWVYEAPDTTTFRYRVHNMVEALRHDVPPRAAASWFSAQEIPRLFGRIGDVDTIVLARVRYDAEVARLIAAAKSRGVKVLFDCDDLVFDARFVHLVLDTLDQDTSTREAWDTWFAYFGRLEAVARLCDGGITTNSHLAGYLENVVQGPVKVVPNFLNRRQQEASEHLLELKRRRSFQPELPTAIGYFSGTPTHNRDLAIAAPALARLLDRDPDLILRIVGFMEALGPLSRHAPRIEMIGLHDWINLQRLIAGVEINIAPLQQNAFTDGKSELKYFEAAAVGTWTLASPTAAFRQAISTNARGRLVADGQWEEALTNAVAMARDPRIYGDLAEANANDVFQRYGWNRFAARIIEATLGDAP